MPLLAGSRCASERPTNRSAVSGLPPELGADHGAVYEVVGESGRVVVAGLGVRRCCSCEQAQTPLFGLNPEWWMEQLGERAPQGCCAFAAQELTRMICDVAETAA